MPNYTYLQIHWKRPSNKSLWTFDQKKNSLDPAAMGKWRISSEGTQLRIDRTHVIHLYLVE